MPRKKESTDSKTLEAFLMIEYRDPNSLIPYSDNAKVHTDEQINLLCNHIAEVGFDVPIVVDEQNIILKGHGRRLAALKMGLNEVPVIVRNNLTAAQKKKARIADNKLAESAWDTETLKRELEALSQLGVDLEQIGFDQAAVDQLNQQLAVSDTGVSFDGVNPSALNGDIAKDVKTHTCPACGDIHPAT